MNKHFIFKDNSYWASNGCDCCEDYLFPVYNCEVLLALGSGSIFSEYDIKLELLHYIKDLDYDLLNSYTDEDLDLMLSAFGITYEIEEG